MAMQLSIQLAAVPYEHFAGTCYEKNLHVKKEMKRRKEKECTLAIQEIFLDGSEIVCVKKTYKVKWNPKDSTYTSAILARSPEYKSLLAKILKVEEERIVQPYQRGEKKCEWPLEVWYRPKDGLWRRPEWKEYSVFTAESTFCDDD